MQAKSIGPVLSYRQAKRLLRDIQTKGKVGTEGLPASGVKLRDVWPRWYEDELSRVRRGLKKADTLDIELHRLKAVTAFLRNDDVTKIDKRRLAAYQEQRLVQGRKPRTINSEMGLLCLILGWAKEHGLCSEVPHIQRLPVHRVHNGILIALLFGPSTAELMINHFDYNDDGQISRRELYADLPEGKFTAFVETVSQSGQKAFGEANSSTFAQLVKSVLGANSQPTRKSPSEKTEDLLKSHQMV